MKKFVKETGKKLATGALAILATIGGASAAGLNSPTATIGGNPVASDSDVTIPDSPATTGTIPVKGYQTSKVYNYEFHISWGDMKFIFDRGVYDPATNHLTKKVRDGIYGYCEANTPGLTDGSAVPTAIADDSNGYGVGRWCGFNGANNRVDVENLGNGNIRMNVGCTEANTAGAPMETNGVDMQVGVATTDLEGGSHDDNWALTGTPVDANMQDGSGSAVAMKFASATGTAATAVIQKAFELDGTRVATQDNANAVKFFLNITGTPAQGENASSLDTLSEDYPSTDAGAWEQIGTIDLTFTPIAESSALS